MIRKFATFCHCGLDGVSFIRLCVDCVVLCVVDWLFALLVYFLDGLLVCVYVAVCLFSCGVPHGFVCFIVCLFI